MQNQSRRRKKPTKKEMQQNVVNTFQSELKKNYVKALIQGSEIFCQLILDNINNGKTLEDIKSLCENNLKNKNVMENIVNKENNNGKVN